MGLYTSLIGVFLSGRTIRGQIRKVPMLAINGRVENDHTIKRSKVKYYGPPGKEVISEI